MLLKSMNLGVDSMVSNFISMIMYNYLPFLVLDFLTFSTHYVEVKLKLYELMHVKLSAT